MRIVAIVVGAALSFTAVSAALGAILGDRAPAQALKLAPYNAEALAGMGLLLMRNAQGSDNLAAARNSALAALAREPVNVVALRVVGLTTSIEGDQALARRYMDLATRLSKRDLAAQIWSIEQDVARGDISTVLTRYDEALRTSRGAAEMLLPALINASTEPLVAERLAPFLEQRPSYFRPYFIQGTDSATDVSGVAAVGQEVLDRGQLDDQDLINRIIMRFSRDDNYDDAWRIFAWASQEDASGMVVNGDFDHTVPFRLFNWELMQSDAVSAEILPRGETDSLYLFAFVSRGLAARQLLRLQPGRYRLSALVGEVPDASIDRPAISITCASGGGTVLGPVSFPASRAAPGRLQATFGVDDNCDYQWLNLTASATTQDEVRTWIDDIVIRPLG